jgi:AraC-like DNA-binding protein
LGGALTLEQIADRTGYSSPTAFAATFRRLVGLPPGQWRQQHATKPAIPAQGASDPTGTNCRESFAA